MHFSYNSVVSNIKSPKNNTFQFADSPDDQDYPLKLMGVILLILFGEQPGYQTYIVYWTPDPPDRKGLVRCEG